jgi:superfamily II DNA or RNA helicase
VIFSNLPSRLNNGKLLVIAHRDELLSQAIDKIQHWNPTLRVGLEKAEHHADVNSDVIVACSASVGRAGSKRLEHFWDDVGTIVVDECQHILGGSYLNILEDSGVLLPDSKKLLVGFTATPRRHNKKRTGQTGLLDDEDLVSLKSVFSKITYSFPIRKGIKEGFLSPLHGMRVSTQTNLDNVKVVAGDFAVDQLSTAVNSPERNMLVVKTWKENAQGRPTLCFTVDIAHAKDLAETFMHNGVLAQPIYGDDPQRAEKLKWFEEGKVQVLCNCALLIEGFDAPSVSCVTLARPTRSGSLYTQMIGRGTRLHPGKENCLVVDVCDNSKRCSLVTLPSLLGLSPTLDLHGGSVIEAAEALEAAQDKYPSVDFTKLTDISKIKSFIESIDLFSSPYTEEVKEYSKLAWAACSDGSYILSIPEKEELKKAKAFARFKHEKLHITPNELDEFELSISSVDVDKKLGTYNTLKEAFESADEVIGRCRPDRKKLLLRDAEWHSYPATYPAKKLLRTLSKSKPVLKCLHHIVTYGNTTRVMEDYKVGFRTLGEYTTSVPLVDCPVCKLPLGITAGEASAAINLLKARQRR